MTTRISRRSRGKYGAERLEELREEKRLQWAIINDEYEERKAAAVAAGHPTSVSAAVLCKKYGVNKNAFFAFRTRYITMTGRPNAK